MLSKSDIALIDKVIRDLALFIQKPCFTTACKVLGLNPNRRTIDGEEEDDCRLFHEALALPKYDFDDSGGCKACPMRFDGMNCIYCRVEDGNYNDCAAEMFLGCIELLEMLKVLRKHKSEW